MKKLLIGILAGSISTFSIQPKGYLDILPQELSQEIVKFITSLEDTFTITKLQQKLKDMTGISIFKGLPSAQALKNLQQQLELIRYAKYDDALALIKILSKDKELEFLFNNPDFNRILISDLHLIASWRNPQDIAQALGTPGALEYSRQLEFIEAAARGDVKRVKEFLDSGINVNAKDTKGDTALTRAVQHRHKEIVELLLAHGADINAKDGYTSTVLIYAARGGYKEIAEILIAHGAHVNAKKSDDSTALMHAVDYGHADIIELLLAHHADVNAQSEDGLTALMGAAYHGFKDIVELLIAAGANVNAKDKNGNTALKYAADRGYNEIAELLKKHGAKE